jgi:hypothetical protein
MPGLFCALKFPAQTFSIGWHITFQNKILTLQRFMRKYLLFLLIILLLTPSAMGQQRLKRSLSNNSSTTFTVGNDEDTDDEAADDEEKGIKALKGKKKKKADVLPVGLKTWHVNDFGVIYSIAPDTLMHTFQNSNFTDGLYGEYNTTGNMGAPRMARLFALRPVKFSYFFFADPYDFFITPFSSQIFTNTKSPITNITYHECGNRDNGEDRIRALFAVNSGKDIGLGFKLDYLYGRGYYNHQSTADFAATLWGSVNKERYAAHFTIFANYLKTSENGGITDDDYVKNPENFPSKFGTSDIPTRINHAWNKMHVNGGQLTHRYSLGFRRMETRIDTTKAKSKTDVDDLPILLPEDQAGKDRAAQGTATTIDPYSAEAMSISRKDSDRLKGPKIDTIYTFVPVTSFIHTLKVNYNTRNFLANENLSGFYTNKYFQADSTLDKFSHTNVSNLLAVELHEGFNKWAKAGIRLFARHDFNQYSMPFSRYLNDRHNENRVFLGGTLFKEKGHTLHYALLGDVSGDGNTWGEFELRANADLRFKLFKDSVRLSAFAYTVNREPTYFYRHFSSGYLKWDNDLDMQMTTHIGGRLESELTRTRLAFDIQNIKNYTYFANEASLPTGTTATQYTNNVVVRQASDNIQLLSLMLGQDFRLGILNWENLVAYQTTSDKHVLPLPSLSVYTNLYLKFIISKVLHVEFGADMRYFTKYEAPSYSPALGMFVNQAAEERVDVGNHPVVNVYANFHLQHTRFYIMASHVNYSKDGGNVFLAPHYPYNPFAIKFGISWDFFN